MILLAISWKKYVHIYVMGIGQNEWKILAYLQKIQHCASLIVTQTVVNIHHGLQTDFL